MIAAAEVETVSRMTDEPEPFVLIGAQGAGDAVCLTGAVRDLHLAYPGRFQIYYRGMYPDLMRHSPYFMPSEPPAGTLRIVVAVHTRSYGEDVGHFATMWHPAMARAVGVPSIPVTRIGGDVRLSEEEKVDKPLIDGPYWLIFAGGKWDMTVKWWPTEHYQAVVDALRGKVQFVQVGNDVDVHPPLKGVVNLVGKTDMRDMAKLMYWADGNLGPVSLGMHLAAAVEMPPGKPKRRASVVVAGGRESAGFVQYPGHRYISTVGTMPCCAREACWKFKVQPESQSPKHIADTCLHPEKLNHRMYAGCMIGTPPQQVTDAIEGYRRADGTC